MTTLLASTRMSPTKSMFWMTAPFCCTRISPFLGTRCEPGLNPVVAALGQAGLENPFEDGDDVGVDDEVDADDADADDDADGDRDAEVAADPEAGDGDVVIADEI